MAGARDGYVCVMTSLRQDYDLPQRPPLPMRQAVVMFVIPLLALGLWLVLPDSPITVALLAVTILVAVFAGVGAVLRSRELDEKPGRHPVTPPSIDS
jgi:hypothetical protein